MVDSKPISNIILEDFFGIDNIEETAYTVEVDNDVYQELHRYIHSMMTVREVPINGGKKMMLGTFEIFTIDYKSLYPRGETVRSFMMNGDRLYVCNIEKEWIKRVQMGTEKPE